ncbi:MAG: ABC transporter ATP-binding protein [Candidatus Thorarchaeota archaeon]|nr:ABC transporter ATP-binding protein [Candidatus Thorarchaeota archaeon]
MTTEPEVVAVRATGLTKSFSNRVVLDIDRLQVTRGQVVGLLGPNGAGKTTLMRILKGGLYPTTGDVVIMGTSLKRRADQVRQMTGLSPEEPQLIDAMTGAGFLQLIVHLYHVKRRDADERVSMWARSLGMEDRLSQTIETYSHGMRKRLAHMAALVHNPPVLLLDEPAEGLDPDTVHGVIKSLTAGASEWGQTIIMSSHRLDIVERHCERVIVLRGGRIIADDSPAGLKKAYSTEALETAYLRTGEK